MMNDFDMMDAQTRQNMIRWNQKADALKAGTNLKKTEFDLGRGKELDSARLGKKSQLKKSMLDIQNQLNQPIYDLPGIADMKKAKLEAKLASARAQYDSEFSADAEADYEKRKLIQATEPWSPWGKRSWES